MARPFVSLLTDFGLRDPSAAICRGVIRTIAPDADVLDITHEVPKYAIGDGAYLLWCALPYLPVGSHVAVVDPGVGTERLPVALQVARGDVLVGPDNGLLLAAAERLGGAVAAHVLEEAAYRLPVVSGSFHGRDIFAPAAAHLARGAPLEAFGRALAPTELVPSPLPRPRPVPGGLATAVVYVDTFGNVKWSAMAADLATSLGAILPDDALVLERSGGPAVAVPWTTTFGSVGPGEGLLYEDSYGRACLSVNQGDAAARYGLERGAEVVLRRA